MTRFVAISDTHGHHDKIDIPDGDVLLHAGDLTEMGIFREIEAFNRFLAPLPHTHKIVIAGNHDFAFERTPAEAQALISDATYIEHETIVVEGFKIFGSPWQPRFLNFAFNLDRGPELAEKWVDIPDDVDILLTHTPPKGIGDRTFMGKDVGCEDLMDRVAQVRPKIHLFGHIHEAYGQTEESGTRFINASMLKMRIKGLPQRFNEPIVFDL